MKLKELFDWLKLHRNPEWRGLDGYPIYPTNPHKTCHQLINDLLREVVPQDEGWCDATIDPKSHETARTILNGDSGFQVTMVHALMARMVYLAKRSRWWYQDIHKQLMNRLLRRKLPFTPEDILELLQSAGSLSHPEMCLPIRSFLSRFEQCVADHGWSPELLEALRRLRKGLRDSYEHGQIAQRIDEIIGEDPTAECLTNIVTEPEVSIADHTAFRTSFRELLRNPSWKALLSHAQAASSSRPSGKWIDQAEEHLKAVGREEFKKCALQLFAQVECPAETQMPYQQGELLKGLIWCCSLFEDEEVSRAVSDVAFACYKKIPGEGARSAKVGNACLYTLGAMRGMDPIAQLGRLKLRVKYSSALKLINKALESAAERAGLSSEDIEELAVPTYGLKQDGWLQKELGGFTAEIRIAGTHQTELTWIRKDGKTEKSVPAEVKRESAEDLKALKQAVRDIEKMLPAQRDRIERFLLTDRNWKLGAWRERYLDHPFLANLTRRLIWHFELDGRSDLSIWYGGQPVNVRDEPLAWLTADATVRLWHPIGFAPETVLAWRTWLEEHEITQPFKQAHREVYLLTDAEIQTDTYSNRFAAHILRQHQFAALCQQRGWKYRLQGGFDSFNVPTIELPQWNLRAEFWVEAILDDNYLSDSYIYLYISTDQVRFYELEGEQLPLTEIPSVPFSEVMRDVDLFVGVCSVGNDPNWRDSGEARAYANYWQDYCFGDLSVSAQTRKEVLERLISRLKIARQCSIKGRFLIVKGKFRTYKIHLGSANVLMEPNDQFLCVVPDRSTSSKRQAGKVFLPFEGDNMLSVILSKAFLLANDVEIEDKTITRQIKGG